MESTPKYSQQNHIIPFKTKVRDCAIENAAVFKSNFVDCEYAVFSKVLTGSMYRIFKAFDGNYLHLVGVNTSIPAESFFRKCLNRTLSDNDFDFAKRGVGSNALKGAVRDKIKVLPDMVHMFDGKKLSIQPNFQRNHIKCAVGSSDGRCTLGFAASGHPKSLLKGDYLDENNSAPAEIILKRAAGTVMFTDIIYYDERSSMQYLGIIKQIATEELYKKLISHADQKWRSRRV